jgi:malate dehydrogenase (oxaloacetate-decarboxylating)
MQRNPSPSYSITIRLKIDNSPGMFARIATAIGQAGGDLGAVDIVCVEKGCLIRDITVNTRDEGHEKQIVRAIKNIPGVHVRRVMDRTFFSHRGGKIEIRNKLPIRDRNDLSKVYTPGVARVCIDIAKNREHAYRYTIKGNSVAIITDGSAVLGLGDIGPEAAMPVMEGKAMIFKEFANIDAFPILLTTREPDEIVRTVKNIAAGFGGINLEDISGPRCFDIEKRLEKELDIPVMHDDQHGTAIVILAALINVGRLLKKSIKTKRIVICGAGAAGLATARLLMSYGIKDIIVCDRAGTLYAGRRVRMNQHKSNVARKSNPRKIKGTVRDALKGAHIFIGLSCPGAIEVQDIRHMARGPVLFTLANPEPEVPPEESLPIVRVLATGRSDYPNQINNMLAFPGIFRGLLDSRASDVTDDVKIAAAKAIAYQVKQEELFEDNIIPSPFDKRVPHDVAEAVSEAVRRAGLDKKVKKHLE